MDKTYLDNLLHGVKNPVLVGCCLPHGKQPGEQERELIQYALKNSPNVDVFVQNSCTHCIDGDYESHQTDADGVVTSNIIVCPYCDFSEAYE
jgi:hypothetical protein